MKNKKVLSFIITIIIFTGCFYFGKMTVNAAEYYKVTFISEEGYILENEYRTNAEFSVLKGEIINHTVYCSSLENFYFVGWKYNNQIYSKEDVRTLEPESDMTFYAVWRRPEDITEEYSVSQSEEVYHFDYSDSVDDVMRTVRIEISPILKGTENYIGEIASCIIQSVDNM